MSKTLWTSLYNKYIVYFYLNIFCLCLDVGVFVLLKIDSSPTLNRTKMVLWLSPDHRLLREARKLEWLYAVQP